MALCREGMQVKRRKEPGGTSIVCRMRELERAERHAKRRDFYYNYCLLGFCYFGYVHLHRESIRDSKAQDLCVFQTLLTEEHTCWNLPSEKFFPFSASLLNRKTPRRNQVSLVSQPFARTLAQSTPKSAVVS